MTVRQLFEEAILNNFYSLQLLIKYLVYEKKVISLDDGKQDLEYYLQEKFQKKMNEYLEEYELKSKSL